MITIIGAGPSGVGMSILLKKLAVPFVLVDREEVGASLAKWPKETTFLTPSFTAHGFGALDLNAVAPNTSPAYSLHGERFTGLEYQRYLKSLVQFYELPYKQQDIQHIEKQGDQFLLTHSDGTSVSDFVVLATGEYGAPVQPFEAGKHVSDVTSYEVEPASVIIGGGESAADAAIHLSKERDVLVLMREQWGAQHHDPSMTLAPYTKQRLFPLIAEGRVQMRVANVHEVTEKEGMYSIKTDTGTIQTDYAPIVATGYKPNLGPFRDWFEWDESGMPILNDRDGSTIDENLFLIGPSVRQRNVIFCFLYKYRQRFAVVAETILNMTGESVTDEQGAVFNDYIDNDMFLHDLSCCDAGCDC
ncbi:NAD(P)/FAD-dependent oxidoreductase [Exiguobacterium qingdaonense]|uniref:NAD(P)/FAD-dependent oxidoreductase n=1 Tax=Exiguobacterium qingdaonense TaxID=2751251 RepID=UPI001BEB9D46|nr:NAD(P)/FAD-dependent oxidoreductase [Exiguobacterium qingdaonense]